MSETDISTAAVERLLDGVTAGPWGIRQGRGIISDDWEMVGENNAVVFDCTCVDYDGGGDPPSDADACFIAASRDLVPALLADRDRLAAEVARLLAALVEIDNSPSPDRWVPEYQNCRDVAGVALAAHAARREGEA